MTDRQSVLQPKAKVVCADADMVPRPDWRSWRTCVAFLGIDLALATAASFVALFCLALAMAAFGDQTLLISAGMVPAVAVL